MPDMRSVKNRGKGRVDVYDVYCLVDGGDIMTLRAYVGGERHDSRDANAHERRNKLPFLMRKMYVNM